jgi:type II secretory pathway pseudopilin PulG
MILLVVIAVGLLSLSGASLRGTGQTSARQIAQANARLALQIAIGELQKNLGPDQRVSTDGRLLGDTPRHWVSVWRTTMDDGSPYIVRDSENGGLKDLRNDAWDAREKKIATLVSGNEVEQKYTTDDADDTMVELMSERSEDTYAGTRVKAPRVKLGKSGKSAGSYAWWVGDQGIKANVATRDATQRNPSTSGWRALQLAQDASWSKATGGKELTDEVRARLVSSGQLDLAATDKVAQRKDYHDFTTDSKGLLTDVRAGGWKKDLTAYLESTGSIDNLKYDGIPSVGVKDADNLVGPRNPDAAKLPDATAIVPRFDRVSPNFGLLRDWAKRAASTTPGNFKTATESGKLTTGSGRQTMPVDFYDRSKNDLMPTLVEGSLYYNLSYYDDPTTNATARYGLRLHLYPRVALWNPYQFDIEVPNSMILMQLNGKKRVRITMKGGTSQDYKMYWGLGGGATGGSQQGTMFFRMAGATIPAGQTIVWSPRQSRRYDETIFSNNVMYPDSAPNPATGFYQDTRSDAQPLFKVYNVKNDATVFNNRIQIEPTEWREVVPDKPTGNIQAGDYTQADDYVMLWKPMKGSGTIDEAGFNALPQGSLVSCAYQYGDEDELPVEWSNIDPVPIPKSTKTSAAINQKPDRRTRDGFRLRWFEETQSNIIGSGSLAGTPHFQDAPLATWNMRATYSLRNPFDNVTDIAPQFFGIYTRDLFDGAVDWNSMMPSLEKGVYHGDPFDQAIRFNHPRVLFDMPRSDSAIASLGALQHAKLSEFIWHPTYPLGNSLVDPRIGRLGTEPTRSEKINRDRGGWNQDSLGYNLDGRSDPNGTVGVSKEDSWAYLARGLLRNAPLDQTLIYDLSYEVNHSLWDGFFLSTGDSDQKKAFVRNPESSPLPNGRLLLNPSAGKVRDEDLASFHLAASKFLLDGAFNVNSASEKAWEALLLSGMGGKYGEKVAFPRIYNDSAKQWDGQNATDKEAWDGQRLFTPEEIHNLAKMIVVEVKKRGPFLSLSDFVNRRLRDDETGNKGALQAAIDRAGLNKSFEKTWPLEHQKLPDYKSSDNIKDPTRLDQQLKPDTIAWGAPGFLTQADLLQFIGPVLSARSDTFVVRAYGSAPASNGGAPVEAWCEAVVQRTPVPIDGDSLGLNPRPDQEHQDFGRKFEVVSFRWLSRDEI